MWELKTSLKNNGTKLVVFDIGGFLHPILDSNDLLKVMSKAT